MSSKEKLLLWEVGCEELPAWACDAIQHQLPALVSNALSAAGLSAVEAKKDPVIYVGPRRFSVLVNAQSERSSVTEKLTGPPVKIAFDGGDSSAQPTKAAEGFARKSGVDIAALQVDTERGITFVERTVPSASISELWPSIADEILGKLQFAKPMRWGSNVWRFVRPIRWMVTLHGADELVYDCWGVTSGRTTRTHRFLGDQRFVDISDASSYESVLSHANVLVSQQDRKSKIERQLETAAAALGSESKWSDPGSVLREVVHLVEHPTVLTGKFNERYLALPERVLVTAMQSHQRYLPVKSKGRLAPAFLTVMNGDPAAVDSILPGYERVLAGRLDDAVFSFERDRERGLDDMATEESLKAVVFHARAGSLDERRDRISLVAQEIAKQLEIDVRAVRDAAWLAKADQVSGVVQEFAELEGFAGSLYAKDNGYSDEVCRAIDQQFLPRGAEASLPDAGVPAVLALADKIELLVTMFAIGEQPTGSRDPHGLRRAAIGIMRIVLEHDLTIDLDAALAAAGAALDGQELASVDADIVAKVSDFVIDRVEKRLADDGVRVDAARAARAADLPLLQHIDELARAINSEIARGDSAFRSLLEAQDRSRRLLEKSGSNVSGDVDPSLFEVESERGLDEQLSNVAEPLSKAVRERRFADALALAASLGTAVQAFFSKSDGVMIMVDDAALKNNRLCLLQRVVDVTAPLGDLSQLQV